MENDNIKKKPIIACVIVIIIAIVLIVGSLIYKKISSYEEWVVCTYTGDTPYYKETIKFRYMYDTLYGYYEEKEIDATTETMKQDVLEQLEEFGKDFVLNENLSYEITTDGLAIKSKLYMKTLVYFNYFNEYFADSNISMNSTSKDIVENLKNDYECKITRK